MYESWKRELKETLDRTRSEKDEDWDLFEIQILFKIKASLTKDICVNDDVSFSNWACNCSRPAVFRFDESVSIYNELLKPVEHPVWPLPLDLDILKLLITSLTRIYVNLK